MNIIKIFLKVIKILKIIKLNNFKPILLIIKYFINKKNNKKK